MGRKLDYIAKPLWRWIFLIPFGFMAGYSTWRQEMNPNLPPLINVVSKWHWSVWVLFSLLVVAAIVIEGLWRYNRDENRGSSRDYPIIKSKAKEQSQSLVVGGDNYGQIIQLSNSEKQNETRIPRSIDLPIEMVKNEESIGVSVSSPHSDIDCRCTLESIEVNGEASEELYRRLTTISNLVSWSQGSSDGTKRIYAGSRTLLNIATLTWQGLEFNMQSGNHDTGDEENYGTGTYKLELSLRGKVGKDDFLPKPFGVSFNCWHKPKKRYEQYIPIESDKDVDSDTIRLDRAITDYVLGYLYAKIIKEETP